MKNTRIAVLGGGNGAHTMAADFALRGWQVRLWESEAFFENIRTVADTKKIRVTGVIEGTAELDMVTSDMAAAIDGCRFVCIVTPSFAHENIAKELAKCVKKDQIVMIYPGAFSSLMLKKMMGADAPVICEVNNLPYDTRLKGPGLVYCSGKNATNVAFLPASAGEELLEEVRELHPFEKMYNDVLECGLSIVNPSLHTGACSINIGHIEQQAVRGQFCMYEHYTPAAAKISIAIDNERKAVGKALGYNLRPIEDFAKKPADYEWTWQDLYATMHGDIGLTQITGPDSIWNRYLTEDCPNGLVPWISLGKAVGVECPVMSSFVNMYSIVHERDWWTLGRNTEWMGLAGMDKDQILAYVKTGEM
ncbi:MAG: NAD/NADP octopine/nopaline dehydrogenase family protein [Firmicutes bacterium]|nr:NAD/NADP octopine/nopaline dehydrogenase family protein [Bacillota bacterium]MBQ3964105.1 NAD/NADP octopine/nopaline dehydrogenase family protein [Bacillota bacterium]